MPHLAHGVTLNILHSALTLKTFGFHENLVRFTVDSALNHCRCLARREADLNVEDKFGIRADDIAQRVGHTDCWHVIEALRYQRCQHLSYLARKVMPISSWILKLTNGSSIGLYMVYYQRSSDQHDNVAKDVKGAFLIIPI